MIKQYSYKNDKDLRLAPNFVLKEHIAGTSPLRELYEKGQYDTVLVDEILHPKYLQKIRDKFGAVIETSGYRPSNYNKSINGATSSKHIEGAAADIQVKNTHPIIVAMYCEQIGIKGIGLYAYSNNKNEGWVHIDTRSDKYYWITYSDKANYREIKTFMPELKKGDTGYTVKILQRKLAITQDGVFGQNTESVLNKKYQTKVVTKETWLKMFDT